MAKERWFSGFEDGNGYDVSATAGQIIADAKWPARTGDFFFSVYTPGSVTVQQCRRVLVNSYTCASNGDQVIARMQFGFRVRQYPTSGTPSVGGFSIGTSVSPNQACGILQNTNGTLTVSSTNGTNTTGNYVLQLGKWYVLRLHFQYQRNDSGNDPYQTILQIYDGASIDFDPTPDPLETIQFVGSAALGGFALLGDPCLGSNVAKPVIWDYDDWWLSVASGADAGTTDLNWPGGSRIQKVPITRQVSGTWAGSYLLATDTPNSGVSGNEQTTATPLAQTIFGHQTAVELGLIPVGQPDGPGDGADAEPFTGLPIPAGLTSGASAYFANAQDNSLPVPVLTSFTLTAGAGQFNNGVWVRAFTIEWRSQPGGGMVAFGGPLTAATFLSADAAPNFAATLQYSFGAGTPQDRFTNPANPGTSPYFRYGIGVIVTNGYNAAGLMNPFTSQTNLSTGPANTTGLQAYGGPHAIDAGPWSPIVALLSTITPGGTLPPYANTNPSQRPTTLTYTVTSPRPSGTAGNTTSTNLFGPIFQPPSVVGGTKPVAEAFKITPPMQLSTGIASTGAAVIGSTSYPLSISSVFGFGFQQFAIDWTNRTAAAFDALTFGAAATAGLGATLRLGQCMGEVITAGPCTAKSTGAGQYQQQCGIYTSNNGFLKIPLPFKPTMVFVKRLATTATFGCFKGWWMGGTTSWVINGTAPLSLGIMELQDDGFLVGPDQSTNGPAATYCYVACRDGQEDTLNDAYMVTGSYQRQNTGDTDMTVELPLSALFAASWTPDVVMHMAGSGTTALKTPDMVAPNSDAFNQTGLVTNAIVAVGDKTFTTGDLISSAGQHVYLAYKFDAAGLLATLFQYGAFAGNNGTQVIPTNFQGEVIVLDHPAAGYQGFYRSFLGNVGANSNPWQGGTPTTGNITAIAATDFTVGSSASVTGQTSYWLAWKRDGSIGNTGSSTIPPPDDNTDPTNPPIGVICGGGGLPLYPPSANGNGCVQC